MVDATINNLTNDNEMLQACAYNFPAVLLAAGPERWDKFYKLF